MSSLQFGAHVDRGVVDCSRGPSDTWSSIRPSLRRRRRRQPGDNLRRPHRRLNQPHQPSINTPPSSSSTTTTTSKTLVEC